MSAVWIIRYTFYFSFSGVSWFQINQTNLTQLYRVTVYVKRLTCNIIIRNMEIDMITLNFKILLIVCSHSPTFCHTSPNHHPPPKKNNPPPIRTHTHTHKQKHKLNQNRISKICPCSGTNIHKIAGSIRFSQYIHINSRLSHEKGLSQVKN